MAANVDAPTHGARRSDAENPSGCRAYLLALSPGLIERQAWQHAAHLPLEAAEGWRRAAATKPLHLALILDGKLYLD